MSGLECDRCTAGFYNLASGEGCEKCNCDKDGSLEGSCNQVIYIKKQLLQSDSLFSIHHVLFFFFFFSSSWTGNVDVVLVSVDVIVRNVKISRGVILNPLMDVPVSHEFLNRCCYITNIFHF